MADTESPAAPDNVLDPSLEDNEEEESKVRGLHTLLLECHTDVVFRTPSPFIHRPLPRSVSPTPLSMSDTRLHESQEIMLMKQRVEEMEREAMKLRELQAAAESAEAESGREGSAGAPMDAEDDKTMADSRSIYIGNVRLLVHLSTLLQEVDVLPLQG